MVHSDAIDKTTEYQVTLTYAYYPWILSITAEKNHWCIYRLFSYLMYHKRHKQCPCLKRVISLSPSDTYICISKLTNIVSDNGLSPGLHQAIICTNNVILLIRPLGTNFSEILIEIHTFAFRKMHLKMSSGIWWPFWLSFNVLIFPCQEMLQQHLSNNSSWCALIKISPHHKAWILDH